MFLTASDNALARQNPSRFRNAWLELLVVSALWAVLSIGIWGAAWALFGEPAGRAMPAAMLAFVFAIWPFRRALTSLLELSLPSDSTVRAVGAAALVMLLTMSLLSLRPDWRKDPWLPRWIVWIRPWEKLYRPLLLMPMWGAWAMIACPQFCHNRGKADPATDWFAKGCGPMTTAIVMGLLLALTATYYNYLGWWQLPIPACGVVGGVASGIVFCWREGGLTRKTLLATNLATQMVFLLGSLTTTNLIYW